MSYKLTVLAALAALALGGPVVAQEHAMSHSDLPEICQSGEPMSPSTMMEMQVPEGTNAAQKAMGASMSKMNNDMAMGMMIEDPDVAFVCSMIPHHQGAIDMAKAELEHGDDAWAQEMAQKVIAAQEQEIRDMTAWLEKQPK
jgi:uncharacterized protein (DUF305 family)